MKSVILCGGQGTRIRDISEVLPKPMLSIGDRPILWHIMKIYAHYGIKEFILCLGYKGWLIKEFFLNYAAKTGDITLTLGDEGSVTLQNDHNEADWKITLVETGQTAQTGARIWNIRKYLKNCESFCVTYGDGVADINIAALLATHKKSQLMGTITGVHPSGRFGEMEIKGGLITQFNEKPNVSMGLINGGFMVFNKQAIGKYFGPGDDLILETEVLNRMVKNKQLGMYKHNGFWQCVDTPREYHMLNDLWRDNKAPWKIWK
ncbi:MAG: glucose-1-phosphate cytidylyltransferase [Candidatus Omnitrophica bacterium CG1_02_44_16]|nr:MAG: glucose-1-phosphate cytidylyltransferase [Candidatus Omnitrophica bacterium CG1_02_44_16]PIY83029.1 MAG: glucose-1-phosphate cytidylyltransferase [Candidatus Omnitrophica bacterium CG_4_10_14_0_8_um_filter_44_12]PIZ83598.1 MAG: glucose-1-phosphate cytidylyltransferase [Candidatus Omnitrophica bacterium CG_4_10_14_0_2_um_filter_44_9]